MKKILLVLAVLVSAQCFAQKHTPFVSGGATIGFYDNNSTAMSYSLEGGIWGKESKTSFAALFTYTPVSEDISIGVKPYYTIQQSKRFSTMIYIAPQVRVTHDVMFAMEEGIGVNYTLHKNLLFGIYGSLQHSREIDLTPQLSACFIYLFNK